MKSIFILTLLLLGLRGMYAQTDSFSNSITLGSWAGIGHTIVLDTGKHANYFLNRRSAEYFAVNVGVDFRKWALKIDLTFLPQETYFPDELYMMNDLIFTSPVSAFYKIPYLNDQIIVNLGIGVNVSSVLSQSKRLVDDNFIPYGNPIYTAGSFDFIKLGYSSELNFEFRKRTFSGRGEYMSFGMGLKYLSEFAMISISGKDYLPNYHDNLMVVAMVGVGF